MTRGTRLTAEQEESRRAHHPHAPTGRIRRPGPPAAEHHRRAGHAPARTHVAAPPRLHADPRRLRHRRPPRARPLPARGRRPATPPAPAPRPPPRGPPGGRRGLRLEDENPPPPG